MWNHPLVLDVVQKFQRIPKALRKLIYANNVCLCYMLLTFPIYFSLSLFNNDSITVIRCQKIIKKKSSSLIFMKTYGIPVRKLNCHIFSSHTLFFSWDSRTAVLIFSISLSLSLKACLNCCSSPSFPCKARTFSSAATYNYDQKNKKH